MSCNDFHIPGDGLDLANLSPIDEMLWLAGHFRGVIEGIDVGRREGYRLGYQPGYEAGYPDGWAAADDAAGVVWREALKTARAVAKDPRPYSELTRARGGTPTREQLARERWLMFGEVPA